MLDGVASLIDKSLVQQTAQEGEQSRLIMLETLREYGLEDAAAAHHEPSCMGNGLLNHDPAAAAWIRRAVMKAVR